MFVIASVIILQHSCTAVRVRVWLGPFVFVQYNIIFFSFKLFIMQLLPQSCAAVLLLCLIISGVLVKDSACIKRINPNSFSCNFASPVEEPYFSDSKPYVPLTHIFCGQIKTDNPLISEGFHARPGGKDPLSGRTNKNYRTSANTYPLKCYTKIEVLDYNKHKFRPHADIGGKSGFCFFPGYWSIPKTVEIIQNIYKDCKGDELVAKGISTICARYYKDKRLNGEFDIVIFLGTGRITSAFPTPSNDQYSGCKSKNVCLLNKSRLYDTLAAIMKWSYNMNN